MRDMTSPLLNSALDLLGDLVAVNTTNPPRDAQRAGEALAIARAALDESGFTCEMMDFGEGCLALLAIRGTPRVLFNNHLDTVPVAEGWSGEPFQLRFADDQAVGLGACDVKGAAACWLAAARATDADAAMLFTTDEEAGQSVCVRSFIKARRDLLNSFDAAIVAEPTGCRAVMAHRGLATASGVFLGTPGHGSAARALRDSAIHEACRWAASAVEHARGWEGASFGPLNGVRFNIGTFEGGVKANMIAAEARVRFGLRPLPGQSSDDLIRAFQERALDAGRVRWSTGFSGPSLPAAPADVGQAVAKAQALAERFGLPPGEPVDFWSEASLFSEAGLPSLVFGPGDITQAHRPDESIPLADLQSAAATYARLLSS